MDIEAFRLRVATLMEQHGYTMRSLSLKIGQNHGYIGQMLKATRNKKVPGGEILTALADAFDLSSVDELLSDGPPPRPTWLTEPLPALMRRLGARPFVAEHETEQLISAGKGKGMIQREGDGRRRRTREPEQWVVRVEGRCMAPEIEPGQRVLVETNVAPELNDLVVATLDGERYVLKHLVERENVQYLLPLNGEAIPLNEKTEFRIVGVVRDVLTAPPRPRKI